MEDDAKIEGKRKKKMRSESESENEKLFSIKLFVFSMCVLVFLIWREKKVRLELE